jgi:hypothetical protein
VDTRAFVTYILEKNGVEKGSSLNDLCAHAEFLQQKSDWIRENESVRNFEPIISHAQRPFNEK